MALTEFEKKRLNKIFSKYCKEKVPPEARDRIRIEFQIWGNEVKLFECRPNWQDRTEWIRMKIARFKKNPDTQFWQLYCVYRDDRWHAYESDGYSRDIVKLLKEVESDPTGIFWG